jgi:predicted solute-binding protein
VELILAAEYSKAGFPAVTRPLEAVPAPAVDKALSIHETAFLMALSGLSRRLETGKLWGDHSAKTAEQHCGTLLLA